MHREWHGLDSLRLDTVARGQDDLVQEFVTIVSTEVVSQLPNGLRMYLGEIRRFDMRCRSSEAKRDAGSKDTEDIESVLKVTTPSLVATKNAKKTKVNGR
ncbi:hypothetical protein JG688_00017648 [Phytophthora aleatoria]|uniref:Uncharacterized protein n=1 Tax=Phytophthora aleatoria TaxID=2496075 RepID=A0A8J5IC55_9STRA|nr:hypothetical protein JG688_00017648 [Phytophthora aleatoria]